MAKPDGNQLGFWTIKRGMTTFLWKCIFRKNVCISSVANIGELSQKTRCEKKNQVVFLARAKHRSIWLVWVFNLSVFLAYWTLSSSVLTVVHKFYCIKFSVGFFLCVCEIHCIWHHLTPLLCRLKVFRLRAFGCRNFTVHSVFARCSIY